jgi:CheY-like chemotaxis protein
MPNAPDQRILIADDQPDVIEALRLLLKSKGYASESARSPAAVVKAVEAHDYALNWLNKVSKFMGLLISGFENR